MRSRQSLLCILAAVVVVITAAGSNAIELVGRATMVQADSIPMGLPGDTVWDFSGVRPLPGSKAWVASKMGDAATASSPIWKGTTAYIGWALRTRALRCEKPGLCGLLALAPLPPACSPASTPARSSTARQASTSTTSPPASWTLPWAAPPPRTRWPRSTTASAPTPGAPATPSATPTQQEIGLWEYVGKK